MLIVVAFSISVATLYSFQLLIKAMLYKLFIFFYFKPLRSKRDEHVISHYIDAKYN